ncbi:DUF3857 domain-containing transglutaminase family protein [Mucilaginibacter segetis]|uniref:DUF3857 domain-containing protein n=1 Tax=Mucilaginibacter segetis TaxID=2793071 RepID=A0A934PUG4_9SPHI|nr:DUF3857 domain-containing transglutaminase family protein [Mucilaginibacter segetis]MBK0379757.1 DUF3857 domain-containing protein [Mucilaginibacter segetis]
MKFPFKNVLLIPAIVMLFFTAYSQDKNLSKDIYLASAIPDSLKQDANAVVRYASDELVVKAAGKATKKHHSIVTVLNEKGDDEARLVLFYDRKYNTVNNVEMLIYDAAGKQIKKYRKSDMYDRSATDGTTIVTDDRLLALGHTIASYPTTIEVIYETGINSYLDLGHWYMQQPERAVQYEEYTVLANPAIGFRFKNKNTTIQPVKTTQDGFEKYTWQVTGKKAVKPEDDALPWQVLPNITFAANAFQFDGLPGDFSTWQNYGKWYQGLNADVCNLSQQRIDEIKAMTANLTTDKEKAKFLYQYMQQNMRYVSVQLGIGGLKPFTASFVDEKKYGDCKALTNYMAALLKAVNIPSYYAMVNAGTNQEPADASFPYDPFNHVILCIPFKSDTTWLECTSSTQPFGKLGTFTENRNALLVTENGGKLVNTPRSTAKDNQFNGEVHIKLNADGGAVANVRIMSTGAYRDDYIGMTTLKMDEQKEFLIRMLNMKQPSFMDYKSAADKDGVKEVDIDLEYEKFCDIAAGNKQFYRPRVIDLWQTTLPVLEKRKTDFYFDQPMQKTCVTTIDLPEGFEVETLPANQSLKFTYGNFEINYVYNSDKNQVKSTSRFNLNTQGIPAAKYNEMQQYMDNISKAQNKKLVIRRKA